MPPFLGVAAAADDAEDDATDEADDETGGLVAAGAAEDEGAADEDATDEADEETGGLVAAGAAEDDDAAGALVGTGAAVGAAHAARANKTTSRENNRTSLRVCITSPPLISCTGRTLVTLSRGTV